MKIRYSGEESEQTEIHSLKGKLPPSNGVWERGGGEPETCDCEFEGQVRTSFTALPKREVWKLRSKVVFFFFLLRRGATNEKQRKNISNRKPKPLIYARDCGSVLPF